MILWLGFCILQDLIGRWEKYVADHQVYENRMVEYNDWMTQACQKLEQCSQPVGDQESMEEKRAMIQVCAYNIFYSLRDVIPVSLVLHISKSVSAIMTKMLRCLLLSLCSAFFIFWQILFSEKEHGLQRLNGSLEAGEKLYPDTASAGREKVRQDLRRAKEDWENLFSGLNEAQRRVDAFLMQWTSYVDGQDSLTRWMSETEAALRADTDLRNTLQEKRQQLQNYRVQLWEH